MSISYIKDFHDLAFKEKNNFLKFIYDIGQNGLKKLFKFPGEDFSLWWFTLIAEKSTLKSDAYAKLIALLLSKGVSKKKTIRDKIKQSIVYNFLSGLHASIAFFVKIIYIKSVMRKFHDRRKVLDKNDYLCISYFPLINKVLAKEGVFENGYFSSFHKELEKNHHGQYSHVLINVTIDQYNLNDAISLAAKFSEKQSLFFIEEFFRLRHLLLFIYYYVYFSILFVFNCRFIKKNMVYGYEGQTYNVWDIFKLDFYRSFCGSNLVTSILYILFFKELSESIKSNAKILCVCEMQWWEKALYIFAKKRGNATIGVQHTIVPELILNYFNDPREMAGSDFVENCPLPDYLATVGELPAKLFIKNGWPAEKVFVWGAQRFESLKDVLRSGVLSQGAKDYFVCAFSIDMVENINILRLIQKAFSKHPGYKILLKCHPSLDLEKILNKMSLPLERPIFEFTEESLSHIIKYAKGMIVTESSSCFYALAYGIPVIIPIFADKLDCNPISYLSDVPIYSYSAENLRQVCDKIAASQGSYSSSARCSEFLHNYLYFPDKDREYLEKIQQIKHQGGLITNANKNHT